MTTTQPFVVGISQVSGDDQLGQPLNQTTVTGIASTLAFGTIGGSNVGGSFTVETSQVGGPDVLGLGPAGSRNLVGIASTLQFGTISGGAHRILGIASTLTFGIPLVEPGGFGEFGFATFGAGTFGGSAVPATNPTGAPFTLELSAVGGTDQVGGQSTGIAQSSGLGGIASTLAFGTIGQSSQVAGIASTLRFGETSFAATPVVFGVHGIVSTARLGAPSFKLRIAVTGIASTVQLGTVQFRTPLAGIASTAAFGTVDFTFGVAAIYVSGIASTVAFGFVTQPLGYDFTSAVLVKVQTFAVLIDVQTKARVSPSANDAIVIDVDDLASVD